MKSSEGKSKRLLAIDEEIDDDASETKEDILSNLSKEEISMKKAEFRKLSHSR